MSRGHDPRHRRLGAAVLVGLAVLAAAGVAVIGGVRSFEAVSQTFGSPLVPLTADGMIVACTALRLAALSRGWRLPGSLLVTYLFIAGTVWLNVAAATGWNDAVAHALAPVAYAVLVELLAHMLRLQLRLAKPGRSRVNALTWATSPVITTRVWLHLARTGSDDTMASRALVQQLVRMSSRLRSVCPSGWHRFDGARQARAAALQAIRDGLLTAGEVAALLPERERLTPSELLARIDRAALTGTPSRDVPVHQDRPAPVHPEHTHEPAPVQVNVPEQDRAPVSAPVSGTGTDEQSGDDPTSSSRVARSDEELVAELIRYSRTRHDGAPLSGREVRRVLGVGTGRARRLVDLAGWNQASSRRSAQTETTPTESAQRSDDDNDADSSAPLGMSDAR